MTYRNIEDLLLYMESVQKDCNIYLWGTGNYGSKLGIILNDEEIRWCGYYDNYDYVIEKMLNNKMVFSLKNLPSDKKNVYCIATRELISSVIKEQLISIGVTEDNIVILMGDQIFKQIDEMVVKRLKFSDNLTRFHDLYKGEKCFVIGNGPSLKMEDLERISSENILSFGSNYIFKCYDKTSWRPDYYVVMDTTAVRNFLQDDFIAKLISQNCINMFTYNYSDIDESKIENLVKCNYMCSDQEVKFSEDCSKQIYTGKTVTFAMLQLAVYMGFSEIYLLGMDHCFSTEVKSDGTIVHNDIQDHSKALDCGQVSYFSIDEVTKAYMAARKYADDHGIKIYNATRGGKLEVFERVDFDSILDV